MMKASNIKVVSIDLYRTLVDIDLSAESVWKVFLGENYTSDLGLKYWNRATDILIANLFAAAADDRHFKSTRTIFADSYTSLFKEISLDYDPQKAAGALIDGHKTRNLFPDAIPFLAKAGRKYPICLSTDSDVEMLEGITEIYPFDTMFVSEELKTYKMNPRFFRRVIDHYQTGPENILHIGDSQQDIVTPKKLGMATCWLNRHNHDWKHAVKPDFEVKSLMEVLDILE
jgi:putative hydrolase of the HAD superfamily